MDAVAPDVAAAAAAPLKLGVRPGVLLLASTQPPRAVPGWGVACSSQEPWQERRDDLPQKSSGRGPGLATQSSSTALAAGPGGAAAKGRTLAPEPLAGAPACSPVCLLLVQPILC